MNGSLTTSHIFQIDKSGVLDSHMKDRIQKEFGRRSSVATSNVKLIDCAEFRLIRTEVLTHIQSDHAECEYCRPENGHNDGLERLSGDRGLYQAHIIGRLLSIGAKLGSCSFGAFEKNVDEIAILRLPLGDDYRPFAKALRQRIKSSAAR